MNFTQINTFLKEGKTSVTKIVGDYLHVITEKKDLNIFLEVFEQEALKQAEVIDAKLKAGKAGRLAGMVIALKDNISYKNHRLSASSKILEGFTAVYSATVVERLLAEDAIIIGRCNCDEFAMGSSNESSAFGKVKNPINTAVVPGGSSGGSAAAVAAGMCTAALGTDTGGSIRQPASFCGVVGLKPTYGRVSRHGAIAYASSFDQIGPITQTVSDAALILEVIAGKDDFDSTASTRPVEPYAEMQKKDVSKFRIAYLNECIHHDALDVEVKQAMLQQIETLRAKGHVVEAVDFPYLEYMVPTYYLLTTAEASSNLARYDGVNYGYRSPQANDLESTFKKSRSEGFGKEVQRRILLGTFVLSAGYYDAYYSKGQKVRRMLRDKTNEILSRYDLILLPSTPGVAFEFGKNSTDPIKMYLEDIYTVQANLTGLPAISIPLGKNKSGLPFGAQFIGRQFEEANLLAFSDYVMKN